MGLFILIAYSIIGAVIAMSVVWKKTANPFAFMAVGLFGGLIGAFIPTLFFS